MHEPVISLVRIGQIIDIFAKECPSQPHGPAVIEVIIRMKGNLVLRYLGEPCTGIVDRISWVFFQKIPSFTIPFAVPEKPGIGFRKFQLAKPLAKREFSPPSPCGQQIERIGRIQTCIISIHLIPCIGFKQGDAHNRCTNLIPPSQFIQIIGLILCRGRDVTAHTIHLDCVLYLNGIRTGVASFIPDIDTACVIVVVSRRQFPCRIPAMRRIISGYIISHIKE